MNELEEKRSIEVVTAEIVAIRGYAQRVLLSAAVEIGRRLTEAKELLPYGQWGTWLEERVEFSQATATRYMKLFEEYGDKQGCIFGAGTESSTLQNLSVSNALRLLAVPEEERERFAEENDVENLSARQMDELVKKLEEAKRRAETAEAAIDKADDKMIELEDELKSVRVERDEAVENLNELMNKPVEVAVMEPDKAAVKKMAEELAEEKEKEYKKKERELQAALESAERAAKLAERTAEEEKKGLREALQNAEKKMAEQQTGLTSIDKERMERQIDTMKKQIAMSDGAVAAFRTLFEQAQDIMGRLLNAMEKVEDEDTRDRLSSAVAKLLEMYEGRIGK